jgi:hypothetical protein
MIDTHDIINKNIDDEQEEYAHTPIQRGKINRLRVFPGTDAPKVACKGLEISAHLATDAPVSAHARINQ